MYRNCIFTLSSVVHGLSGGGAAVSFNACLISESSTTLSGELVSNKDTLTHEMRDVKKHKNISFEAVSFSRFIYLGK